MNRGCSSVRESNRLKSGELLKITRNVVSSNLTNPTIPLNTDDVLLSREDTLRRITIPSTLTTLLAEDIGIQIGDGSLPVYVDKKGFSHHRIECCGNMIEDKLYLENFVIPLKNKLFNLDLKLKNHISAATCYVKLESKGLYTFYTKVIGLPAGPKKNIQIPQIILNSPTEIKLSCLRGIADTDFSLSFKKDWKGVYRDPYITLGCSSRALVMQIAEILKDVGIVASTRLDIKEYDKRTGKFYTKQYLYIHGKKNLTKWINLIGFNNPVQITKYKIWKKFGYCPSMTTLKQRTDILDGRMDLDDFH